MRGNSAEIEGVRGAAEFIRGFLLLISAMLPPPSYPKCAKASSSYLTCTPLIARAITRRCTSEVPSKIV
jgi:hypothetical protein